MAFSCVLFMEPPLLLLPIHFPSVADLDDLDDASLIIDCVHNAIIPLADAVPFLPGKLFIAWRAGAVRQSSGPVDDAAPVFFGESA
jgi:hypothetical protein